MIQIAAYIPDYGELTIVSKDKKYIYKGISPYLYDKINFYISKRWFGKVWQILRRMERETAG